MKLLYELPVQGKLKTRKVQLYQGDLSEIPSGQDVDLLVISAFPGNYDPTPNSLIGALYRKGVSVQAIAKNKEHDMLAELGCWLSTAMPDEIQQTLHFKRILCFEPSTQSASADEVVGNIFRCINNFVFDESVNNVAMPVVATGNQQFPLDKMCLALLNAATFWLEKDLPIDTIQLVQKDSEKAAETLKIFQQYANEYKLRITSDLQPTPPSRGPISPAPDPGKVEATSDYDLFISYSHKQKPATDHFVKELLELKPNLKVFYDDYSIPKGSQWLKRISDAIDSSEKVLIFISPDYTKSRICWDEFQCAKIREYNSDQELLITIYLNNHTSLPTVYQLNNYIDCRESDEAKLKLACTEVVRFFESV